MCIRDRESLRRLEVLHKRREWASTVYTSTTTSSKLRWLSSSLRGSPSNSASGSGLRSLSCSYPKAPHTRPLGSNKLVHRTSKYFKPVSPTKFHPCLRRLRRLRPAWPAGRDGRTKALTAALRFRTLRRLARRLPPETCELSGVRRTKISPANGRAKKNVLVSIGPS